MKVYFFNSDYSEQSIRQMQTTISYVNADLIVVDNLWEKHINHFIKKKYVFEKLENFLIKNKDSQVNIVFFNIIDGFRVINKTNKFNVKLIFRPRGILPEESYYKSKNSIKLFLLNLIEKFVIRKIDSIIYLTDAQQKHYELKYRRLQNRSIKKFILPNIKKNDTNFPEKINSYSNSIVYSGGFSKWQNIELIFKIISEIIFELNIDCTFTVLTFESNFQKAKELAEKYSIEEYTCLKYVSPNELDRELRLYNIGIIIRDNDIVNTTSSPFKVIDYISNGLGVILTDNISWQAKQILNEASYYEVKYKDGEIIYNDTEIKNFIINGFKDEFKKDRIDKYENYINRIKKIDL